MKIAEYVAVLAGAVAIGAAIGSTIPVSTAWPGEYLFPPSPYSAGKQVVVVQWCDRPEDMQTVIDTHALSGKAAASKVYDKLVESDLCHLLPDNMPTAGLLTEETSFAYYYQTVPGHEKPLRFIVEVWGMVIEGIEGREVFGTFSYWSPEFSDEDGV